MEAAGAARTASPAMPEWIERDVIADFEVRDVRADFDDFARRFVAENDGQARDHPIGAEFPIDDVQVGAANAARADADQQRRFAGRRHGSVDQFGAGRGSSLCDRFICRTSQYLQYDGGPARRQRKTAQATLRRAEICSQWRSGAPR